MPFASQHLFATSSSSRFILYSTHPSLRTLNFSSSIPSASSRSQSLKFRPRNLKTCFNFALRTRDFSLRAYQFDDTIREENSDSFDLDAFLSVLEFLCIFSAAVLTVSYAVNCRVLSSRKTVLGVIGSSSAFGWGVVALVGGEAIGQWIRRRQWRRICVKTVRDGRGSVNLVERIEKLEEDLRSSATFIRVLSRQLEKLGIRFRVTRKSLKEPIAETAALAQKNSEATRALAIQEDILEKELVEIQKVLLAMQEQQQKQLELILAIVKSGRLFERRDATNQAQKVIKPSDMTEELKQEIHETQDPAGAIKGSDNDKP